MLCDALVLLNLQTRRDKNKKAKAMTKEEFTDIMGLLVRQAREDLQRKCGLEPIFSYDNNSVQANAKLAAMNLAEENKLELPPWSPDMHKVIEHVFAVLKGKVQARLLKLNPKCLTPAQARDLVEECFFEITTQGIRADIESMPITWHIISTEEGLLSQGPDGRIYKGAGGGWAPTGHR